MDFVKFSLKKNRRSVNIEGGTKLGAIFFIMQKWMSIEYLRPFTASAQHHGSGSDRHSQGSTGSGRNWFIRVHPNDTRSIFLTKDNIGRFGGKRPPDFPIVAFHLSCLRRLERRISTVHLELEPWALPICFLGLFFPDLSRVFFVCVGF